MSCEFMGLASLAGSLVPVRSVAEDILIRNFFLISNPQAFDFKEHASD
jgi:hypothetical protein